MIKKQYRKSSRKASSTLMEHLVELILSLFLIATIILIFTGRFKNLDNLYLYVATLDMVSTMDALNSIHSEVTIAYPLYLPHIEFSVKKVEKNKKTNYKILLESLDSFFRIEEPFSFNPFLIKESSFRDSFKDGYPLTFLTIKKERPLEDTDWRHVLSFSTLEALFYQIYSCPINRFSDENISVRFLKCEYSEALFNCNYLQDLNLLTSYFDHEGQDIISPDVLILLVKTEGLVSIDTNGQEVQGVKKPILIYSYFSTMGDESYQKQALSTGCLVKNFLFGSDSLRGCSIIYSSQPLPIDLIKDKIKIDTYHSVGLPKTLLLIEFNDNSILDKLADCFKRKDNTGTIWEYLSENLGVEKK